MKNKIMLLTLVMAVVTFSQTPGRPGRGLGPNGPRHEGPFFEQLTEEQRAEMSALIEELRAADVGRAEIHEAVVELLNSWGIDLPERGRFRPRFEQDSILVSLSEDQRAELHELVSGLIEADTEPQDINTAVIELLTGWGIELPENWQFRLPRHRSKRGPAWLPAQLTEEQRQIIFNTVQEMQAAGADRQEIRAAVQALLADFGVESPGDDEEKPVSFGSNREIVNFSNKPNPFNPDTHIHFTLKSANQVRLSIYNIRGELIRSLVDEYKPAGSYSVYWNGRDRSGRQVVSGIYIYQITAGNEAVSKQMMLMK